MPADIECQTLDFALHRTPEALRAKLQEKIDESGGYDTIVLAYGACGLAVLGLQSQSARLVVPRADDCIAILLGSRAAYLKQQFENPGSLFLSKGWIEGRIDDSGTPPVIKNYQQMVEKYGEERARRMQTVYQEKHRLRHYQRMAFITTEDESDLDEYKEQARRRAAGLNLSYEEITGSMAFMDKIAGGQWDEEFVVVPPRHPICFADFWLEAKETAMPGSSLACSVEGTPPF
ncbi:MAG: DUF1638 domain-containing protein [Dehalococcoidales bacterium]|nr:DUF1638 domain-containing protein [Dehalococcoidales bacterium]MDP6633052.1 DUF1638 domain-containing protein [Dehalococcoidales bacterium]